VARNHSEEDEQESRGLDGTDSEEYRKILHRFLLRHLGNAQDADDLAQESYVRFFQLPRTEAILKPRSYLFRVAQNLVYEYRLRQSREREFVTVDSQLFEAQARRTADVTNIDPGEELSSAELVNRILMQVPPGYRKVLVLHKRDGMTSAQIAKELGLTKRSVEIYIARAMTYARAALWK